MPISFRRDQGSSELAPADNIEEFAYLLIESARIRCERLRLTQPTGSDLTMIHQDLGLAGYYCSSRLSEDVRRACLERAHARCDSTPQKGLGATLLSIFEEAVVASDVLTRARITQEVDELQTAALYVSSASESLDQYLTIFV